MSEACRANHQHRAGALVRATELDEVPGEGGGLSGISAVQSPAPGTARPGQPGPPGQPDQQGRGLPTAEALAGLRSSDAVGVLVPAGYGGWGGDAVVANRVVADLARTDPSLAIVLFQHLAVSARITQWGTPEQQERLLPELAAGRLLAASAWSEAGAGANKKNLATMAEQDASGWWSLSGVKSLRHRCRHRRHLPGAGADPVRHRRRPRHRLAPTAPTARPARRSTWSGPALPG